VVVYTLRQPAAGGGGGTAPCGDGSGGGGGELMMDGELNIGKLMGDLELLLPLLPREKRAPLKQTLAGMTANPVALAAAIDRLRAVLAKQNARRAAGLLT
jgi:hypothetical protein